MPGSPHILVVDDEVLATMALEHGLLDDGFAVTTALDGQEAWQRWREEPFDALVTDLRMPLMTGDTLIRHIREEAPHVPVIVVSGYATNEVSERLKADVQPPFAVMPKPVRVEDIVGALKRMLG